MESFKKNKKGISGQIMLLIIMGIVLMSILMMIYIYHLVGAPVQSIMRDTGSILTNAMQSTEDPNIINASASSFEPALRTFNNLEWIGYTLAILSLLVFMVMCFYVRVYPFLIFIWIIFIIILVILSIYMSVAYQGLVEDATLGGYYTSWESTDFILQNLPAILIILGVVGGVIMFMLASREPELESGGSIGI